MHKVYLSLGTNLGDRMNFLIQAYLSINNRIGKVLIASSIYETEPWGFNSNDLFLNQVLLIQTNFTPIGILNEIHAIESEFGRSKNSQLYESRNIDIDILFYDDLILHDSNLRIPHPLLHERKFTLLPLIEIAKDLIHPVLNVKLEELEKVCNDKCCIEMVETKGY
jgi:2-amino-4-hydroxy-6-hydroxymethyldihydropteridine diphosphokinase